MKPTLIPAIILLLLIFTACAPEPHLTVAEELRLTEGEMIDFFYEYYANTFDWELNITYVGKEPLRASRGTWRTSQSAIVRDAYMHMFRLGGCGHTSTYAIFYDPHYMYGKLTEARFSHTRVYPPCMTPGFWVGGNGTQACFTRQCVCAD